jgi:hypothetical protein
LCCFYPASDNSCHYYYITVTGAQVRDAESISVLLADDTRILVKSPNKNKFQTNITVAFNCINEWLKANLLSINFDKTHFIQFITNNKPKTNIKIKYDNKQITVISNIKFVGIQIDKKNWKYHIEHILPKLSVVCYVIRSIKPYVSLNTLRIIYYSKFNSIINYGLPFWGNSSHSIKIFRIKKNIIRTMLGCKKKKGLM